MKKELAIFFTIIFLSGLFEFVGWLEPLRSFGQKNITTVASYNVRLVEKLSKPYNFLVFSFRKSLYLEQLEAKYAQALAQLNELDALRAENKELKKLLGASDRRVNETTIIGAPILSLAYPAVGVGSLDGVQENDMVLIDQVLVGTIESVSEYQAKVSLLTSKRKKKILAKTESGVEGVIDGDGINVLLTHIPRSVELKEGERVVTVGQEGIEKNILIGTIQRQKNSPADATNSFIVSQLVTFYSSVLVEVK